jgi:hypothetical protein
VRARTNWTRYGKDFLTVRSRSAAEVRELELLGIHAMLGEGEAVLVSRTEAVERIEGGDPAWQWPEGMRAIVLDGYERTNPPFNVHQWLKATAHVPERPRMFLPFWEQGERYRDGLADIGAYVWLLDKLRRRNDRHLASWPEPFIPKARKT